MAKPSVPCAGGCGSILYRSTTSAAEPTCRECRRHRNPEGYRPKACARCCEAFTPTNGRQAYCTEMCRWGRLCEVCGKQYVPTHNKQRTCGRACGTVLSEPTRTRHRKPRATPEPKWPSSRIYLLPCRPCGRLICKRSPGQLCPDCRASRATTTRANNPDWPCRTVVARQRAARDAALLAAWSCTGCGSRDDMYHLRSPYCVPCRTKARRDGRSHRSRARKYGVAYEPINSVKVYARDGWTCGICGDPIDPAITAPSLMCASLDHIVPMSLGGPHLYSNVQPAHWLCNTYKGTDEAASFRLESVA